MKSKTRAFTIPEETYLVTLASADRMCISVSKLVSFLTSVIVGSLDREFGIAGLNLGLSLNPRKTKRTNLMWEAEKVVNLDGATGSQLYAWARALGVASSDLFASCAIVTLHQLRTGKVRGFVARREGFKSSSWPHELQGYVDALRHKLDAAIERGEIGDDGEVKSVDSVEKK